jgi:hypothetical protein
MKTIVNSIFAKALVAVALTGAALSASADLLYWTVTDAKGDANSGREGDSISFSYATVSADGTRLNIYDESGNTGYWQLYVDPENPSATGTSIELAAYAGTFDSNVSTFLVELWNDNDARVGWQSYSKSSVADYIWHGDNPTGSSMKALTVSAVVPEPTSGMLLVLGGALLALRRRRRVMA